MPTVHCLPRKFFRRRGVEPPFRWGQGAPGHVPVTPCHVSLPPRRGGGSPRRIVGKNKRGRPADEGRVRQGGATGGRGDRIDDSEEEFVVHSEDEEDDDEFVADSDDDEDFDVEDDRWDSNTEDDDSDVGGKKETTKKDGKKSASLSRADRASQVDDDSEESQMLPPRCQRGKHHGKKVDMTVGSDSDSSGALMDDIYPSAGKSKKAAKNAQSPIHLESDASDDQSTLPSKSKKPKLSRYVSNAGEEKNEEDERPPLPPINFPADESSIADVVKAGGDDREAVDTGGEDHAHDVSPKPGYADTPTKPKRSAKKTFEHRLEELRAYKEEHGHLRVSKKENPSLANFCANVRYAWKHPETGATKLSDDRTAALDALGFTWEPRRKVTGKVADRRSFEEYLDDLRAYHQKHGHVNVDTLENKALANFCFTVRHARRHPDKASIKLTDERIDLLNLLGFDWSGKDHEKALDKAFFARVEELKAFKHKYGHLRVTKKVDPNLASFCSTVRHSYHNPGKDGRTLSEECITALDTLGFMWEVQKRTPTRVCSAEGCKNKVVNNSVCVRHGAKVTYKKCTVVECSNLAVKGGVCHRHGAKKTRKQCRVEGCTFASQRYGVCRRHGATRKVCNVEGCTCWAKVGGICVGHGAKVKSCEVAGCDCVAIRRGVCWKHGGKTGSGDKAKSEATKVLKRIACGNCNGCKREACGECEACTGNPKKRCIHRLCSNKQWVDKSEYDEWRASGKSTRKPLPLTNHSERKIKSFSERMDELRKYKEEHGHLRVSAKEDPSLAHFVSNVRIARNHPKRTGIKLTEDYIASLDALGFDWAPKFERKSFAERLEELKAYKQEHGHLKVTNETNESLAKFCMKVRRVKRNPEKYTMKLCKERVAALDALNFVWGSPTKKTASRGPSAGARKTSFFELVEQLRAYKEEHGHINVTVSENKRLARFCYSVRFARKKQEKSGLRLGSEHIKALDDLGFQWGSRFEDSFSKRLNELREFKEEHGHLLITNRHNKSLAGFCERVRRARSDPENALIKLNEDRIAALNDVGFQWHNGRKKTFHQRVEDLRAYKAKHGHLNVEKNQDQSLFSFCNSIRYGRNHPGHGMKVTEDRIAALDELGFNWSLPTRSKGRAFKSFADRVAELKAYKEKHGHLNLELKEDPSLFRFCNSMRFARNNPGKKTMTITDERIAALDAIGFNWSQPRFAERVEDLKAYKEKHGHLDILRTQDQSLFNFCANARTARNNPEGGGMKMTEERIAALDAIGFQWSAPRRSSKEVTLKRIACGECNGCKRKACNQCEACTGSPKKRCVHRVCSKKIWVDKAEYEAWKASGKSTPKPVPKSIGSAGLSEWEDRQACRNALGFDQEEESRSPIGGERLSGAEPDGQEVAVFAPNGSGDAAPEERIHDGEPSAVETAGVLANHIIESGLHSELEATSRPRVQQDVLSADEDWGDDEDGVLSEYGFLGFL